MQRVEAAGYPIVLHVHDEIVCEVPLDFGSTDEFIRLMTRNPRGRPICRSQPVPGRGRGTASERGKPVLYRLTNRAALSPNTSHRIKQNSRR